MTEWPGLDPGERVLVAAPVSFGGALAATVASTFRASSALRDRRYRTWAAAAEASGFPAAGPEMHLGVTDDALCVWSTTFGLGRPAELFGRIPRTRIVQVATARRGLATTMSILLDDGNIVAVEAMRGRRLRALAAHLRTATAT